jgi:predicted nucleic acid-binding protein
VIVVDASVVATALLDDGPDGERVRERLIDQDLFAPELLDLEVASAWRRVSLAGTLSERRATQALSDLADLPLIRSPHKPLIHRIWDLRDNLTSYDAAYVALAEALDCPLLTADERLSRAPGPRCEVMLFR